jgi:hypothetical protein
MTSTIDSSIADATRSGLRQSSTESFDCTLNCPSNSVENPEPPPPPGKGSDASV